MKTAKVNGVAITSEAVQFELERLVKFYYAHGFKEDEIRKCLPELQEKALEQAIGAKLLLDRASSLEMTASAEEIDEEVRKVVEQLGGAEGYEKALAAQGLSEAALRKELEKGVRVNKLVAQACTGVDEPTEEDIAAFFEARKADYAGRTIVDVHDQIRDLIRHDRRGRALDAFVKELRAAADVEYVEDHGHGHDCGCGCHHGHEGQEA